MLAAPVVFSEAAEEPTQMELPLEGGSTRLDTSPFDVIRRSNEDAQRALREQLDRVNADARRANEGAVEAERTKQASRERRCNRDADAHNCARHRAAQELVRNSGKTYDEAFSQVSQTIPRRVRTAEDGGTESRRPTHSDATGPKLSNNPTDPAVSTESGKNAQQGQPIQQGVQQGQQQQAQQQQQQQAPPSQQQPAYNPNQDLRSKLLSAIGGMWEQNVRPTPTPGERSAVNPQTNYEWPASQTSTAETEIPPMDTEVNTGVAQAAHRCYMKSGEAAKICSGALARAQGVSAQIQQAQLSANSGNPSACASVGNATASANQQIQGEQSTCAAVLAQCAQICASAQSQVSAYPGTDASVQVAEGASVCQSAQATSASIAVNQTQIQAAYQAAAQCYQQTTGTEFTPTTGSPALRRASADFGKGTENGGQASACPGGVCTADANTGSQQMPNPAKLLVEDEAGGGGGGRQVSGGGYAEAYNMPDFGSKFQATSPSRKVTTKPGQPAAAQAAMAPAKNPGFFIKDKEAERRAREFANLPRTRGQAGGGGAGDARLAQKPGLERFVRRPANQQMGIGGKHTNIFTTITQSYARHSDRLQP